MKRKFTAEGRALIAMSAFLGVMTGTAIAGGTWFAIPAIAFLATFIWAYAGRLDRTGGLFQERKPARR